MKVNLVRSSTWCGDDFEDIDRTLDEIIKFFVKDGDRIINIETKERNGAYRFWIYIQSE